MILAPSVGSGDTLQGSGATGGIMQPPSPVGEPGNLSVSISSVHLAGGGFIKPPRVGVTVIVGPNNAGKSTLIREMAAHLRHGRAQGSTYSSKYIVESVELAISGSPDDAHAWALKHAPLKSDGRREFFSRPGVKLNIGELRNIFANPRADQGLGKANNLFCFYGDAWQRLGGISSVEKRDSFKAPAESPLHVLQDRPDIFAELKKICEQVFGVTLTLDLLGKKLHLRVGEPGVEAPKVDEVTEEYWAAVDSLPMLTQQGDGMKSLIGLMVPLVAATFPIVFVDEPEAFLHPPQALALGKILGEQAQAKSTQVVLATHDRNILSGLLQSGAEVSIVRLDRSSDRDSQAHQLNVQEIREIWSDPVLRYSNVLDGIFHKAVVLAEAERDCKFYASVLDCMEQVGSIPILASDVLFVPSGGKDGFPRLAKVMKSLKVPVAVSPDLDILNDGAKLKVLIAAMGGDWRLVEGLYGKATAEFKQPREATTIGNVLSALNALFSGRSAESFSSAVRAEFGIQMRSKDSPWQSLKKFGVSAFRADRASGDALLSHLRRMGIVAVHVGELECFAPAVGVAKGPSWLPAAIQAKAHESDDARQHVAALLAAASSVQ
ncbi:AAA family ATPase [Streptomyces sp. NPDC057426]|uniref:ATP-dependent nuclease n=1 Tax=Streptomyces sp. NPDC057426 TaxID=3346128 RepID=UPI00369ACE93